MPVWENCLSRFNVGDLAFVTIFTSSLISDLYFFFVKLSGNNILSHYQNYEKEGYQFELPMLIYMQ